MGECWIAERGSGWSPTRHFTTAPDSNVKGGMENAGGDVGGKGGEGGVV
jgi:hypothetical protein